MLLLEAQCISQQPSGQDAFMQQLPQVRALTDTPACQQCSTRTVMKRCDWSVVAQQAAHGNSGLSLQCMGSIHSALAVVVARQSRLASISLGSAG